MTDIETQHRYQMRQGPTYRVDLPGLTPDDRKMYLTINHDLQGKLLEVFARYDVPEYHELIVVITRMVSMCLREGVAPEVVARELQEIHSPVSRHMLPGTIAECPSLTARIGQVLETHINSREAEG